QVHCNNLYTKSVKIFHRVECYFKQQLVANWEPESVGVTTVMDDKNPSARFVVVPLGQRLGKAIRCRFYFADRWMLFSEISFQSTVAGNDCHHSISNQGLSFISVSQGRQPGSC
ncbi:hypothetical protein chiPu_0026431, partial [Chiloscyllium punctatum]|nr:hypothetical protein [Chiloscyllium punctatum]